MWTPPPGEIYGVVKATRRSALRACALARCDLGLHGEVSKIGVPLYEVLELLAAERCAQMCVVLDSFRVKLAILESTHRRPLYTAPPPEALRRGHRTRYRFRP